MKTGIIKYMTIAFFCLITVPQIQAQQGVVVVNQDEQIDALLKLKKDINRRNKILKSKYIMEVGQVQKMPGLNFLIRIQDGR